MKLSLNWGIKTNTVKLIRKFLIMINTILGKKVKTICFWPDKPITYDILFWISFINKYEVTTHFMGQSTVVLDVDRATGETYCIAHHVLASEGKRTLFIASLRYYDVFTKVEGKWLFAGTQAHS